MRVPLALAVLVATPAVLAQPPAEGAMGSLPIPRVVGMAGECPGYVLGRGRLNAAEHEMQDGSFNVGHLTVVMPRGAVALLRARDLNGTDVEIVVRPIAARELERVR